MTSMRSLFVLAISLGTHGAVAAEGQPNTDTPELRQRAEDLARAASERFTDILDGDRKAVAQAKEPPRPEQPHAHGDARMKPVWDWLERSAQSYDDVVVAQLKSKDDTWTTIVEGPGGAGAASEPAPQLRGWSGLLEHVRHWLARANRAYRTQIVTPLSTRDGQTLPAEAEPRAPIAASAAGSGAQTAPASAMAQEQAAEAIRREAEAADKLRHEAQAAEEKRAAEEAESKKRAQLQAADIQRRADEEKRLAAAAAEKRKAQEEARARLIKEAEDKRAADEAESKRRAEEQAAEIQRRADEEKRRESEAAAKTKADAEAKRVAEAAEAKRKADEARRQAEEADAAERVAVAQYEAETKRKADIDAEATKRMEAAARSKEAARASAVAPTPGGAGPSTGPSASASAAPAKNSGQQQSADARSGNGVVSEDSSVAMPVVPEKKPADDRGAAKAAAKSREDAVDEAIAVPTRTKKTKSASRAAGKGKSYAYAKKAKRHAAYKAGFGKRPKAHVRKRRWEHGTIFVVRHCACRCGRQLVRPRTYGSAGRHVRVKRGHHVTGKHRGGWVTHWHRRHYID